MADDTDTTGQAWLSDDDSATPAPAPAPTNPPTGGAPSGAVMPSYDDFKQQYVNAAAANEKLNGGNHLLGWLTGAGRNAAVAQAQAQAPLAYFKLLGAQAQAQGMQMDAGQTKAYLERSGFKVNDQTGHVTAPDGQSFSAQQAVQALQPPAATAPPPAAAPGVPGPAASPMPATRRAYSIRRSRDRSLPIRARSSQPARRKRHNRLPLLARSLAQRRVACRPRRTRRQRSELS